VSQVAERSLVVALSGGVGGAKLVLGLSRVMDPASLVVIANTGDDFEHLGLSISPDLDTLLYTLAGINDPLRGWGRRDETWTFMAALAKLASDTWFQLGDGDLAIHVERTRRLRAGEPLSDILAHFCRRMGVATRVVPMSDDPVRTRVHTPDGWLDFQDYFVRRGCGAQVLEVAYEGAAKARAHPQALASLRQPQLRAVIICPSNPHLSIAPILAIPGLRNAIASCGAPVIAVSPIVAGRAVKGPTAKIMSELGEEVSALAVARRYGDLLDGYVLDGADAVHAPLLGVPAISARTVMQTLDDRTELANRVLAFADSLARASFA
jgi:LPPG:FO 2-phospho-L-lactate transferase